MLKTTEGIIMQDEVVGLSRFSLPFPTESRVLNRRWSCSTN